MVIPKTSPTAYPLPVAAIETREISPEVLIDIFTFAPDPSPVIEYALTFEYDDVVYTFNIQTGLTDVWNDINFYDRKVKKFHSTQKPIPLVERIIKTSSNKGQSVLDIFGGSGSTGVACQMHNREFIGCEIDKNYYNQSHQRIISTEPVEEVSQDRFNPLLDAL